MLSRNSGILITLVFVCAVIVFTLSTSSTTSISNSPASSSASTNNDNDNVQQRQEKPSTDEEETKPPLIIHEENNHHDQHNNQIHNNENENNSNNKNDKKKHKQVYLGVPDDVDIPDLDVNGCDQMLPDIPLSPLEEELRRLLFMTVEILHEKKIVGWPADGTLLGLVRNGRVATDRDIDFQIHSTYQWCADHLRSLKEMFEARTKVRMFKVVYGKFRGKKIGRYAMVRMPPKFGDFGTGVDFNCVYTDNPDKSYSMHVHKGTIETIPQAAYPLKFCLAYGRAIPCPHNPMAILGMFKPRYDGCMLFPHCTGDPLKHGTNKKCLTPHMPIPMQAFADSVKKLDRCGWVSLKSHMYEEPVCQTMLADGDKANKCEKVAGWRYPLCFLQKFKG